MRYSIKSKVKTNIAQETEGVYILSIEEEVRTNKKVEIELLVDKEIFPMIDKVRVNCGCVIPLIENDCIYVEFTPKYLGEHSKTITIQYVDQTTDYIKLKARAN